MIQLAKCLGVERTRQLTLTVIRSVTTLRLAIYVCDRLGHAKRQCCSRENMAAIDGTDQGINILEWVTRTTVLSQSMRDQKEQELRPVHPRE